MAYKLEIAAILSQLGYTEIEYNLIDEDKVMPSKRKILKFKSTAPSEEEISEKSQQLIDAATQEYIISQIPPEPEVDYYYVMQSALDGYLGAGTYDSVRRALKDVDSESVQLDDDIELNVTYPVSTVPEKVDEELQQRIDAELGSGKFLQIKQVLKMMGIENITIYRKSSISL